MDPRDTLPRQGGLCILTIPGSVSLDKALKFEVKLNIVPTWLKSTISHNSDIQFITKCVSQTWFQFKIVLYVFRFEYQSEWLLALIQCLSLNPIFTVPHQPVEALFSLIGRAMWISTVVRLESKKSQCRCFFFFFPNYTAFSVPSVSILYLPPRKDWPTGVTL